MGITIECYDIAPGLTNTYRPRSNVTILYQNNNDEIEGPRPEGQVYANCSRTEDDTAARSSAAAELSAGAHAVLPRACQKERGREEIETPGRAADDTPLGPSPGDSRSAYCLCAIVPGWCYPTSRKPRTSTPSYTTSCTRILRLELNLLGEPHRLRALPGRVVAPGRRLCQLCQVLPAPAWRCHRTLPPLRAHREAVWCPR